MPSAGNDDNRKLFDAFKCDLSIFVTNNVYLLLLDALVRILAIGVKFVSVLLKLLIPEHISINCQRSLYLNIRSFNIFKPPGFSLPSLYFTLIEPLHPSVF